MLPKSSIKTVEYICNKLRQHHYEIDDYTIHEEAHKIYISFSYHHRIYRLYFQNIIVEVPEMMLRYEGLNTNTKPLEKYIHKILEKKILALGGEPLYEKNNL